MRPERAVMNKPELPKSAKRSNDPYQILLIALAFFVPGVIMVCHRGPALLTSGSLSSRVPNPGMAQIASEQGTHIYGFCIVSISVAIAIYYFHLRRQIRRD